MSNHTASGESPTRTYDCPCCNTQYTARVEVSEQYEDERGEIMELPGGLVWKHEVEHYKATDGAPMDECSNCRAPCCPRCVRIFGEGRIVCTRCTTNRGCAHDGSDYGG